MRTSLAALGFLVPFLCQGCATHGNAVADVLLVSAVDVTPPSAPVIQGQTLQLSATPKTSSGIAIPGRDVAWASEGSAIASVSSEGLVTAKALGGPVRITATVEGVIGEAFVTVTVGPPARLAITTQPSGTASSGAAFAQQPVIQVRDASGNPVSQSGIVITAVIASGGGTLGGATTATTSSGGVTTFTNLAISGVVGSRTLGFSAANLSGATSTPIAITAGSATQLTITTQPSGSAQSGVPFAQQPVLQLRDGSGNAVGQAGVQVSAAIVSGGGVLTGSATVSTNASGAASFTNLSILGLAGNRTLGFSAAGLTGVPSGFITVTAGPASNLAITVQPSSTVSSGTPFPQQPVIQLVDAANNPVAQAGVAVTAGISSGGGSLTGTTTVSTNGSGVATFTNLAISGTTGSRTLLFTAAGLTNVSSASISVTTGAGTQLTYNTQPSTTANSGAAFATQPVLLLKDAANNPVGSTAVTATITGSPAGVTFVGTPSATTNGSGVATFVGLGLSGPVGSYTLTFTSGAATSAASNSIALSAGAAAQLTYNTQPSTSATSGAAFVQQPVLLLRDAANNPVGSTSVTVTISTSPGGASFVGTPSATTNGSGLASFVGLGLSGPVGNYKLTFTSGAATSAASNTITLSAGVAANIAANSPTSQTATVGTPVEAPPSVKVTDAAGNPKAGVSVTFDVTAGGGSTVPGSPATLTTNASGVATLTSWTIGTIAGTNNNTVTAVATGLAGSPVTFTASGTAGPPTQMAITQQPSVTAPSNTVFAQQPIIQVKDANGNPVSGVVVTAAIQTGTGTLGGTTTKVTDSLGNATFTDLKITGLNAFTLRFSATGPLPVDSNIIFILFSP